MISALRLFSPAPQARPRVPPQARTREAAKTKLLLLAKYSGLFALARQLTKDKARILAYHGIWLGDGKFGNFLYMSAATFSRRMALLAQWQYPIVPLSALTNPDGDHPPCATAITIDDGWHGTWSVMLPVLEQYNYPATVYLTTYYCLNQNPVIDVALQYCFHVVENRNIGTVHLPQYQFGPFYLKTEAARQDAFMAALDTAKGLSSDWERQGFLQLLCRELGIDHEKLLVKRWFHLMNPDEVRDAAARGISFECHTHHHRTTHRGESSLAQEIIINSEHIQQLTGKVPQHFCYPSGHYSQNMWPTLEKNRLISATTTDIGLVDGSSARYALPRILDGQDVSELEFEAEMSGFMELVRRLRTLYNR